MVMPMGVNGISPGDTMLNNSTVLRREKLRKVIADQTTVQDRKKSRLIRSSSFPGFAQIP